MQRETARQMRRRQKKERQKLARANNKSVRALRLAHHDGLTALEDLYNRGQQKATGETVKTFMNRQQRRELERKNKKEA